MNFLETKSGILSGNRTTYLGKYRGTVINNIDSKVMGRVQVIVPDVSSTAISTWAMPCLPGGGMQAGLFTIPLVGAGVWVEFEQGDPDYPIWTGCYWGSRSEVPSAAQLIPPLVGGHTIQTPLKNYFQISDVPGPTGGIQIRTTAGASISVTDVGIVIDNGKGATITLLGNMVDINNGALSVI